MRDRLSRNHCATIIFSNFIGALSAALHRSESIRSAMEPDNPGFVWAYGWNRASLRIIGAWPENDENFIIKNRGIAYALNIFFSIWIPMAASLFYAENDITELARCLVILGSVAISMYKITLLRKNREGMARDWARSKTDAECTIMSQKAKWSRFISIASVCLTSSMFIAFAGFGTYGAVLERRFMRNDTPLAVGFLYPCYFPFDTRGLLGYLPTWFAQFFGAVISMFGYSGPDSAITMMILHICGQLSTLRVLLNNIVDDESVKDRGVFWKRLSAIVKRHEELNCYGEMLEESFNLMLLAQMTLCTVVICFQAFVIFTMAMEGLTGADETLDFVFVFTTVTTTVLHLLIYCWAGDLLAVESTALSYAPYESDWFRLEPDEARALMMLTFRCRIPLQITAGKFVGFSLELFTNVMKTSMGYLSVMLAVKDD